MIILQDTREQKPLVFGPEVKLEVIGLPVGDYGLKGFSDWNNPAFIVERKSIDDLVASLTHSRERFMREIEKMRQFGFRALLIEGRHEAVELKLYASLASPASILASLDAIAVRAGVHIYWCGDPSGTAQQFLSLARQFLRGIEKNIKRLAVQCEENQGESCRLVADRSVGGKSWSKVRHYLGDDQVHSPASSKSIF